MTNRLLEVFFIRARVDTAETVGRFRRVRLRAAQLRNVAWKPGQQVRVDVGPAGGVMPTLRTYSVWDRSDDTIELYALVHGDGPGAVWAGSVAPGATVLISKPTGDFVTRPASYHLFVGDETAAVAFGPMIRALPADAVAHAVIEVGSAADELPISRPVQWLHRGERPAASSVELVAAVTRLPLTGDAGQAYVAGEARTIQAVREHLVRDRGWPRRSVLTKPFWTPGKRGME